jgi:hypothetical protein
MAPRSPNPPGRWTSLWITAFFSLLVQLWLCQFFSFGTAVPLSLDVDPCNLWKYAYQWPPNGEFLVLNWLGLANLPPTLNPFSVAAHLPPWLFFTTYAPVISTLALLAMAAFLRELELPRPAALFGGVIFAWQGDILPFVFPGHYAYIATWPFFALAAWGALRSQRTGHWAGALISGASCGMMVGLQPDRGAIASLFIAALYLGAAWKYRPTWRAQIARLALCAGVALVISLAAFLALFQSFIVDVSMGGETNREETYKFDTQFSSGPEETLTYLVPGFFGWHSSNATGPYWGRIGQWPDWPQKHEGTRNLNLGISTAGTIAAVLALLATALLLPGRWLGPETMTERQRFFGRLLLALGAIALVLSWGYHTPFYRALFALPLMDKWRNPLKWLEITNFALITLSAYGMQHLLGSFDQDGNPAAARRRLRIFLDGMFILLAVALLGSWLFPLALVGTLPAQGYEPGTITAIVGNLHVSLLVAAALMASVCVAMRLLWKPEGLRGWKLENPWLDRAWHKMLEPEQLPVTLALKLALLSVLQLGWIATQFIRPTSLDLLTRTNALLEELRSEGNTVRVSVASQDPMLNILLQNQFSTPQISCLEISAASRVPDVLNAFLQNFDDDPARLWFLAGVKNRVVPQPAFADLQNDPRIKANIDHVDGYMLEPTSSQNLPSHALIQFRDYLAKATFVPGAEILPPLAQLERMKDPNWNPRATVLLTAPAPEPALSETFSIDPHVELTNYDASEIDLNVQAPSAGYILIDDAYDPDWQTQVDGHEVPLLRADYLLRALPVPGGSSTVTLHYVAHYHVDGWSLPVAPVNLFCDAAMLLAWMVGGVALWRRRNLSVEGN